MSTDINRKYTYLCIEKYQSSLQYAVIAGLCLLLLISISLKAWLAEDAFITYRTIANFFDGYGLRWNIDERVQTYTHPLWMLLHLPLYGLTHNIYLTSIVLCLFFSTLACAWVLIGLRKKISMLLLCTSFFVPLLLSKAFGIFATSGFECPLLFALYAAFSRYFYLWQEKTLQPSTSSAEFPWLLLTALASLCMLARPDTILLFLPLFAVLVLRNFKQLPWLKIGAGLSPIILWTFFSLLYYGMPFPNTKYAKLHSAVPLQDILLQGWYYWLDLMRLDLISATAILLAIAITGIWIWHYCKHKDGLSLHMACIGLGLLLYLAYIFRIGGASYALRHWAMPFFIAMIYINYSIAFATVRIQKQLLAGVSALLILIYSMHSAFNSNYNGHAYKTEYHNIIFTHYNQGSGIDGWKYAIKMIVDQFIEYEYWTIPALEFKVEAEKAGKPIFKQGYGIGIMGYYAGPWVIFSDTSALADPLLARLPSDVLQHWRIDHALRTTPKGYVEARMHNDYSRMDKDIAYYYQKIRLITQAPVFNIERIKTVIAFNLGLYEDYRERYVKRCLQEQYDRCSSS